MTDQKSSDAVTTLVRSIRRQFCHNDLLPNVAAVSIGRALAEMADNTEAIWNTLTLPGLSPSVIYSCLGSMARRPEHNIVLEEWLVAFDKQLETNCLDACIPAFARATVTGSCRVTSVWTKLSSLTQQRLAQSIVELTFELQQSWDDVAATLAPLLYSIVLQSPVLASRILQQVQNAVWRYALPPDATYTAFAQRVLVLYASLSYHDASVANDWCCHVLDCLAEDEGRRNAFLQEALPKLAFPTRQLESFFDPDDARFLTIICKSLSDPYLRVEYPVQPIPIRPSTPLQSIWKTIAETMLAPDQSLDCMAPIPDVPFPSSECWRMVDAVTKMSTNLSPPLQLFALFVGLSTASPRFLQCLIRSYPSLAITVSGVLLDRIHSEQVDVLAHLDLLMICSTHPVAAQTVWNALEPWVSSYAPEHLRNTVIRRLPELVEANSRLLGRVVKVLTGSGDSVVAAASLSELAERDLIRDVSEIIGTVQQYLTSDNAIVCYYGLKCLYHLVESDELDFDVVVKVMQKKLCSLDAASVHKLPPLVQQGVALFLASGSIGANEKGAESGAILQPSPQIRLAVRCLLAMGQGRSNSFRLQTTIFASLAHYSLSNIGVTEEDVQNAVSEASDKPESAYCSLRNLVFDGLSKLSPDENDDEALLSLAIKLMEYEEEIIGPALWHGSKLAPKSARSSLASTITALRDLAKDDALTELLLNPAPQLVNVRDAIDEILEGMSTPLDTVLRLQALLAIMNKIKASDNDGADTLVAIEQWEEEHVSLDAASLAVACHCCLAPSMGNRENKAAKKMIQDFRNGDFENGELGKISMGLIGSAFLRHGNVALAEEVANLLLQAMTGYGGARSFSGFYGLGLMAQASLHQLHDSEPSKAEYLGMKCCRTIVEGILDSFDSGNAIRSSLVKAFDEEEISEKAWAGIHGMSALARPSQDAGSVGSPILICVALTQAPLAKMRPDIARAVHGMLEKLDGGIEIGVALCASIKACYRFGAIKQKALLDNLMESAASIEDGVCENVEAVACAVEGSRWLAYQANVGDELPTDEALHGHRNLTQSSLFGKLLNACDLPLFGGFEFKAFLPQLSDLCDDKQVESIVMRLIEGSSRKVPRLMMALGLISLALDFTVMDDSSGQKAAAANSTTTVDFGKLPSPQHGLLTSLVFQGMKSKLKRPVSDDATRSFVRRAFVSVETLSIPEKYCKGFLDPLFSSDDFKAHTLRLLLRQGSIRRRAYSSGSAYIEQIVVLCKQSVLDWQSWPLESVDDVVTQLGDFGPRIPFGSFKPVLDALWQACLELESITSPPLRVRFLQSLTKISKTSRSERYATCVQDVALQHVFVSFSADATSNWPARLSMDSCSAIHAAALFLHTMPADVILHHPSFRLDGVSESNFVATGFCVMGLLRWASLDASQSQQRGSQVMKLVSAFLASSMQVSMSQKRMDLIRRVLLLQAVVLDESFLSIGPIIDMLFVLSTSSRMMGLEWLAMACWKLSHRATALALPNVYCDDSIESSDLVLGLSPNGLAEYFQNLIQALPETMVALARRQKMLDRISNDLARLLDQSSDDPASTSILLRVMLHCHQSENVHSTVLMEYLVGTNPDVFRDTP